VNNVFHNFEKWGFEIFLVGHFWGVHSFYPLRGAGPQILFSIIIALGALSRTVFVWGGIGPYLGDLWRVEKCDFGVLWPILARKPEFGFRIFQLQ